MMKVTQESGFRDAENTVPASPNGEKKPPKWWEKIDWVRLLVSLTVPLAAGGIVGALTASKTKEVYAALIKPPLAPPGWLFLPVWAVLYVLMGIALYLVGESGASKAEKRNAYIAFGVQLALNVLWPIVFFLFEQIGWAAAVILALLFAVAVTMVLFMKCSRTAARLLLPYLAWVAFASYLNIGFALLN